MARKTYAAALAAIAVLGAASAARAALVEDEFARICMPSKTASEAAARARAEGYVTPPTPLRATILRSLKRFPEDSVMLWRISEGEMSLFVAVSLTRDRPVAGRTVGGEGCVIASAPTQPSLQLKMERMLDVGPAQAFGNDSAYIFELTDQGPARLDGSDRALMNARMLKGSVRVAAAIERQDISGLMLMIPTVSAK